MTSGIRQFVNPVQIFQELYRLQIPEEDILNLILEAKQDPGKVIEVPNTNYKFRYLSQREKFEDNKVTSMIDKVMDGEQADSLFSVGASESSDDENHDTEPTDDQYLSADAEESSLSADTDDHPYETRTFQVSGPENQVTVVEYMLGYISALCSIGSSRDFVVSCDGDGGGMVAVKKIHGSDPVTSFEDTKGIMNCKDNKILFSID